MPAFDVPPIVPGGDPCCYHLSVNTSGNGYLAAFPNNPLPSVIGGNPAAIYFTNGSSQAVYLYWSEDTALWAAKLPL
jgi:hypothetical protein